MLGDEDRPFLPLLCGYRGPYEPRPAWVVWIPPPEPPPPPPPSSSGHPSPQRGKARTPNGRGVIHQARSCVVCKRTFYSSVATTKACDRKCGAVWRRLKKTSPVAPTTA